jgi:hypothetical protein
MIIRLPDTFKTLNSYHATNPEKTFGWSENKTIIFGANLERIAYSAFSFSKKIVLDFRKAKKIPTRDSGVLMGASNYIIIVPDDAYDSWITATNWVGDASKIIRATEYEAQGGTV